VLDGVRIIQFHSWVPQESHLGPTFFILDINGALNIFENESVLGYARRRNMHSIDSFIRLMGRRS
jgi:hypothetical protein